MHDGDSFLAVAVASQLQGHVHWIIEYSIGVVAAIAARNSTNVGGNEGGPYDQSCSGTLYVRLQIPDLSSLELLRELLVLVYVWNTALPQAVVSVTGTV